MQPSDFRWMNQQELEDRLIRFSVNIGQSNQANASNDSKRAFDWAAGEIGAGADVCRSMSGVISTGLSTRCRWH